MTNGCPHLPGGNVRNKQHYSVVVPNVKRLLSLESGSRSSLQVGSLKGQQLDRVAQS